MAPLGIGFIGTGAITSAIVNGLSAVSRDRHSILLSPRNALVSSGLASKYEHVRVALDNQTVLNESDVVFLAMRPQVAPQILSKLSFRPDHHVVSLVATLSLEQVSVLVAPAARVTRAVPLPSVALRQGPTAIYPPDPLVSDLFGELGLAINVASRAEFDALCVATAVIASYFDFADTVTGWLVRHGVNQAEARGYIARMLLGLATASVASPQEPFASLSNEHATSGGLNEQFNAYLRGQRVCAILDEGLDAVLRRIEHAAGNR
jgi:pyrroline-5-carboxylate reductase